MKNGESLPLDSGEPISSEGTPTPFAAAWLFWVILAGVVILWMLPILGLHVNNSRLLASWHGFLHAAIANQITKGMFPPENPFFAGEVLPYYWVYHYLGNCISSVFHIDQLHAFQGLSLLSLVVLVVSAAIIGKCVYRSTGAGLLIGYFALVGVNPLGPAIAAMKHFLKGIPLFTDMSLRTDIENIFVSWELADTLMTQSLLPAMYIMSNWKHGQNLVWFFDISSRTPALALVVVSIMLFLMPRLHVGRESLLFVVSGITTSLSPLIGFGMAGGLLGGAVLALTWARVTVKGRRDVPNVEYSYLIRAVICVGGCVLAYPTYSHLLAIHDSTLALSSFEHFFLKTFMIGANFIILIPLAFLGSLPGKSSLPIGVWSITFGGLLLSGAVPIFSIKPGNEHNLTNIAQCFLAVSAVWGVMSAKERLKVNRQWRSFFQPSPRVQGQGKLKKQISASDQLNSRSHNGKTDSLGWLLRPPVLIVSLVVLFLPVTFGSLVSYTSRPPIPLATHDQLLVRLPLQGPLNSLYEWIRESTTVNAIFVSDPHDTVKMSGNVAELPAFTGRTLFVGSPTYMTQPYQDRLLREHVAKLITQGQKITAQDFSVLRKFQRPLFVITYSANEVDLFTLLYDRYGPPLFHKEFIAVFGLG